MAKRVLVLAFVAVCLLLTAPAALAQVPNSPYIVPPVGGVNLPPAQPPKVGAVELVKTPPRAAAGESTVAGEETLPVTGADLAGLAAVGAACIAVGAALRRRRSPQPAS